MDEPGTAGGLAWATAGLGWTTPVGGGGFGRRPEAGGGGGGGVARSYGGSAAAGRGAETDSSLGLGAEAAGGPVVGGAQLGVHFDGFSRGGSCQQRLTYTQQRARTPALSPPPGVAQSWYIRRRILLCMHILYVAAWPTLMHDSPMLSRPPPKLSCLLSQNPYTAPHTPVQRQSTLIVAQAPKPLPSSMHMLGDCHSVVSTRVQRANHWPSYHGRVSCILAALQSTLPSKARRRTAWREPYGIPARTAER